MVYSDILLRACKKLNLVDASLTSLLPEEKNLYSYGLQEAISEFNNDPGISIGNEIIAINDWLHDPLYGHYARIVRNGEPSNLQPLRADSSDNPDSPPTQVVASLKKGSTAYNVQEIPIRLLSVSGRGGVAIAPPNETDVRRFGIDLEVWRQQQNRSGMTITEGGIHPGGVAEWQIVNENDFQLIPDNMRVCCYIKREHEGILRVKQPGACVACFNRAIYFPYQTAPNEFLNMGDSLDPLEIQVDIPTNHISYLVNLTALEIGLEIKVEQDLLRQLGNQLDRQRNMLIQSNVQDRVNISFGDFDYVYNLMNRRAWR